jgi:hypothetical protein
VFESRRRLEDEINALLETLREDARGRYACLLEAKGLLPFETPEPADREIAELRRLLEERAAAVIELPRHMAAGTEMQDVFAGWEHDELFVAVLNGRVAVLVACPEAEPLRERALKPLRALADRLLRYNEAWRMDAQGRGFFFGRPRLDIVVVGRPA